MQSRSWLQVSRAYAAQAMASFTTREEFRQPLVDNKAIEVGIATEEMRCRLLRQG